ncbi:MAG: phage tail protein [Desulfobacterales bacterium]|nr:phage tail protein [Desulfobacterales bacterium]
MSRDLPYGAFNYVVNFDGSEEFGGFSDVSGLGTELTLAEYRNGNDPENHVSKIPGVHKVTDVTLKRGIIDSTEMWNWINLSRTAGPAAKKNVSITLLDEAREAVQTWTLRGVLPMKYTGPTLAAKGGGDVAMEELVLAAEGFIIGEGG